MQKVYRRKAWFDIHVESHRSRNADRAYREILCEYCKLSFNRIGNLATHIRSVHLLLKPFGCVCGRVYSHSASLDKHRRRCGGLINAKDVRLMQ